VLNCVADSTDEVVAGTMTGSAAPMIGSNPPAAKPLRRDDWLRLLAGLVGSELEPPLRRRAQRYPLRIAGCRLLHHTKHGRPTATRAWLMQVSAGGVMVLSEAEVARNAPVLLECPLPCGLVVLSGTVMHCTGTVGGNKIGIRLSFE